MGGEYDEKGVEYDGLISLNYFEEAFHHFYKLSVYQKPILLESQADVIPNGVFD
jgi:hypothetical protein